MAGFLKKIIGDANEREIKRLRNQVEEINRHAEPMRRLSDSEMRAKTLEFKQRLASGETEQDILPEAFALVREAAERMTGMRPFDVQLLGGIVLHQGRIAEMKTGEGKTLVATMPAYLNALSGRGVHIVTVNDYLARRDSGWMGPVFKLLGLSVGLIVHGLSSEERRESYQSDVVYGTNNEFGFDYLRDNMVTYKEEMVQRELHYAIIDEVDSILIDEARTPLIISSRVESRQDYQRWQKAVENLIRKQMRLVGDALDQAQKHLTGGAREEAGELLLLARRGAPKNKKLLKILKEPGVEKLVERTRHRLMSEKRLTAFDEELYFSIDEITKGIAVAQKGYRDLVKGDESLMQFLGFDGEKNREEDDDIPGESSGEEDTGETGRGAGEHLHTIHQLLKAYSLYEKDVDYVVQNGKIIIVDEFTGRLMWGRRYSDGLHQAIEAREGVEVQAESRTVASITFQNYFRMYNKLSGMTGTAATEEDEFRKIYGMDVVVIPTNKPMIRHDLTDRVYKTERAKFNAAAEEIIASHQKGQPVLVGTISVERSEMLSRMLKRRGIPHYVLNAVNHEQEAKIIAQAGSKGAVTISTNMAGRGTDIVLGGNPEHMALESFKAELRRQGSPIHTDSAHGIPEEHRPRFLEILRESQVRAESEHREVVELGGLHVIGTERHESRRIDNQLRGRSGRQGDPGSSHFFVSLEDDLMRLFGAGTAASIMDRLGLEEDQPIDHPLIGRAIQNAQKKVEMRNFEIRRHLLDYDDVLNRQREIIYSQRKKVLEGESLRDVLQEMVSEVIRQSVDRYMAGKPFMEEEDAPELLRYAQGSFLRQARIRAQDIQEKTSREIEEIFTQEARAFYEDRESRLGAEIMRELERVVLLRNVDRHWVEHIDAMHDLRQEINLRAYGQRDPLVEYRHESFEMFETMIESIQAEVVRNIYQLHVLSRPERRAVISGAVARRPDQVVRGGLPAAGTEKAQPVTVNKVGRNEPCPCGSGKKFKKCCGDNQG